MTVQMTEPNNQQQTQPAQQGQQATEPSSQQQTSTTVLQSAAGNNGGSNGGKPEIPDKFHVKREDGTLDEQATLGKFLNSYQELEKRMGSGEAPPKDETGYKLDYSGFPEGFQINVEAEKRLLKRMHGGGLSNKQVQTVIDHFGELLKEGAATKASQTQAKMEALKTEWATAFDANLTDAYNAFNAYADDQDRADIKDIGNNVAMLRILAKIGKELKEDRHIQSEVIISEEDAEQLRKSEAYWNKKHPDHKATFAKVTAHYNKKYQEKKG